MISGWRPAFQGGSRRISGTERLDDGGHVLPAVAAVSGLAPSYDMDAATRRFLGCEGNNRIASRSGAMAFIAPVIVDRQGPQEGSSDPRSWLPSGGSHQQSHQPRRVRPGRAGSHCVGQNTPHEGCNGPQCCDPAADHADGLMADAYLRHRGGIHAEQPRRWGGECDGSPLAVHPWPLTR